MMERKKDMLSIVLYSGELLFLFLLLAGFDGCISDYPPLEL